MRVRRDDGRVTPMEMVRVAPPESVEIDVVAPPSKSVAQRMLVCAALAGGDSRLESFPEAEDVTRLRDALRQLGIRIVQRGEVCEVRGGGGRFPASGGRFDFGDSGAALRFFAAVAALGSGEFVLDGSPRLRKRPMAGLVKALNQLGARAQCEGGSPPVRMHAGGLRGGLVELDSGVTSQFLSALLLAAPAAESAVEILLCGSFPSAPYVDRTLDVMRQFGVDPRRELSGRFRVPHTPYRACDGEVPGDAAAAGYFLAMAAVTGGQARVSGWNPHEKGEAEFPDLLQRMGGAVRKGTTDVEVRGSRLRGIDVDMNDLPDSVPTLAVTALFADGPTRIRNVGHLRWKESDRLSGLSAELRKLGAEVEEGEGSLRILPPSRPREDVAIDVRGDHRMAMAFSVVGAVVPIRITGAECVRKSHPGFWDVLSGAGFSLSGTARK